MTQGGRFSLNGRVAVLTGAAGLLGGAFAGALTEAGADVVLCDIDAGRCRERERDLPAGCVRSVSLDVTDPDSVENAVREATDAFGGVDILVNGAYTHISTPFEDRTLEDFERILRVNLTGVFLCCQRFSRAMKARGRGSIINIGSIYGVVSADPGVYGEGSNLRSPEVYAASKGGVIQLTRYLAVHLAKDNIRVNSISPAGIFNNQSPDFLEKYCRKVPLGRMAMPDEMAGALIFLASDAASYVTGHNLMVDGGFTVW